MNQRQPDIHAFSVVEPSAAATAHGPEVIRLGSDVDIRSTQLRHYLARPLHPEDVDVLLLAGVAARVDRVVRRQLSRGWARRLHIRMPVHEPERWSRPDVSAALREALDLLTGDEWSFEFVGRRAEEQVLQLPLFPRAPARVSTLSYSGGLDSYCGLAMWQPAVGEALLLVHTRNAQSSRKLIANTLDGQPVHHVSVPVHFPKIGAHAEDTYRTRTFTFLVAAAVGSRLGGGSDVVVSENGQGALGPALVRFPGEHPYYSTHPIFTRRLADFLGKLWSDGAEPRFRHPAVLRTKGEVLRELAGASAIPNWRATRSCSQSNARNKGTGAPSQCGVCGGCLLRRLSLHTAGLAPFGSDAEGYLWADLSAERLDDSVRFDCPTTDNDRRIAVHAALGMASLCDFADAPPSDHTMLTLAEDVSFGLGVDLEAAAAGTRRLVRAHRDEWRSALAELAPSSWLRRVAEERI